jgi:hypothetical protein
VPLNPSIVFKSYCDKYEAWSGSGLSNAIPLCSKETVLNLKVSSSTTFWTTDFIDLKTEFDDYFQALETEEQIERNLSSSFGSQHGNFIVTFPGPNSNPEEGQSLPLATSNEINNGRINNFRTETLNLLVRHLNQKGGTTFLVSVIISTLAGLLIVNQMDELVFVFLKCAIVSSLLLAWYWISAQDEIRTATDVMFLNVLKGIQRQFWWLQTTD